MSMLTRRSQRVRLYYILLLLILTAVVVSVVRRLLTQCRSCEVYDLHKEQTASFNCPIMDLGPKPFVCLFPTGEDLISREVTDTGVYEPHVVRKVIHWLKKDRELGFIDIGSHLGVYSLAAADVGSKVLAVEANMDSITRFHKAVQLGELEDRVTLLHNAVGDQRGPARVIHHKGNQAQTKVIPESEATHIQTEKHVRKFVNMIYMDDLASQCSFKKAILKIDISGDEHRAFLHASRLFSRIDIVYVIIQWKNLYENYYRTDSKDRYLVFKMVAFLLRQGYVAKDVNDIMLAYPTHWDKWPEFVIFERHHHGLM